ncbi:hypothetical protein [Kitasatospora sp. GAS1066B]|uniref:hypothetical protein n=1 Tax=Kitasatospora sp. GAS1066B TaxID=3156271 RepID=UPI003511E85B
MFGADEDSCERAVRVLELLALAGVGEAREALREYVRRGEHWVDVLESVAGSWPVEWWDDLAAVAKGRLVGDEDLWSGEPWVRWQLRSGAGPIGRRPAGPQQAVGSDRLIAALADPGVADGVKVSVLQELARRPEEPALIALIPSLGVKDGTRQLPSLSPAVGRLGAQVVPAAREWAVDEQAWLSWLGIEVLAAHGESRDLPVLLGELAAQWEVHCWCGPDTLAAGLARFGPEAAQAEPLLRRYWLETPHSYERPAYLKALAAIDLPGVDELLVESLWDCEEESRLLGIAAAPELPQVRERLVRLRDDPAEEQAVRTAAAVRLR